MKILLIANLAINDIITTKNCKTRSQFNAYLVYKYLTESNIPDLEVIYRPTCPQGKCSSQRRSNNNNNNNNNSVPVVDHIIFVEDRGLFKRSRQYLEKLKKSCRGTICAVTQYNKHYSGEDLLFYFSPSFIVKPNSVMINPLIDASYLVPKKSQTVIKILVDDQPNIVNFLADKLANFKSNKDIFIVKKNGYLLETYSIKDRQDNKEQESVKACDPSHNNCLNHKDHRPITKDTKYVKYKRISNYTELLYEFSEVHIYFMATHEQDEYKLSELAVANVLMVANTKIINKKLQEKFDVTTFDIKEEIPWSVIFGKLENFNLRDRLLLLKDMTYKTEVNKIYNLLQDREITREIDSSDLKNNQNSIDKLKTYKGPPLFTFIRNALRSRPTKSLEQKAQPKPKILLQSKIGEFV